jgi:PAS domain S-box-containing protein
MGDDARRLAEVEALAHLGSWEWDIATNTLAWSDELYQILGLSPQEVPASFEVLLGRVHTDDLTNVKSYFARARRDHCPLAMEYRVVRPTGEIRTLQARLRGTFDDQGGLARLVGTVQDITDSKEVAARVVFSDRMISVGTLAGGVAHEINNPLATISANLQILAESYPDAGLRDVRKAVERIRIIVRGLMAFSRADEDHRSPIEVEHVLELAIGMTSNEIRHRGRLVKHYGSPPVVFANEARLGHVFINLLVNAAEAIPEGRAEANEIRLSTRTDAAGWVVVEIQDSGGGIPPHVRDRIFDPFFTTKPVGKGTGLGLSISHGIVRSLGGEITFRSEVGKGSTFIVALPPATETARPIASNESSPRVAHERRGHVLIVDDEVLFATSLRRLLSNEHTVTVVNSGRDALAKVRAGERYDVILCDLMMPEISGADLHATLSELAPDLAERMIFITGGAFSPASQQFLERITNQCFEKPCDVEELRAAIRRCVSLGG